MSLLTIRTYPDDVLHEKAARLTTVTDEDRRLIDNMVETLFAYKGVGLAAPQVGVLKQIIVAAPHGTKKETYVFINPVIVKTKGEVTDVEGCLSIPCASGEVKRAKKVWVEALDPSGKKKKFTAENFLARIIQHETDHLHGKLFIDHLGFVARREAIDCTRKVKKL